MGAKTAAGSFLSKTKPLLNIQPHPQDNRNRRVLIIDDNRSIHDDFRKILSPGTVSSVALDAAETALFGSATSAAPPVKFEVDSAFQGQEGALLVKAAFDAGRPYAMAFVDIRMPPGWDGVETTQKIWAIDPDIQIVICTAYSDYSWDEMFALLGHRDGLLILKKPFDTIEAVQLAHTLTEKWWLHLQSQRKMEELEIRVAERTGELQHTNQMLETKVAEHEHAENKLRESDQKFRHLADNITDVFWITSPDLKTMHYISAGYEAIWGRSTKSLYAHPHQWVEAILPEDRERVSAVFATLMGSEPQVSVEYRIARPDGAIRWVHDRGFQVRNPAGDLIRLTGIATDITERKQVENALGESNEKFHQLADNITDAFWIRSPDMRTVQYVSPAFERIWGRSVESLYANPERWSDFILPEDRERVLGAFAALTTEAPGLDIEYRILRPGGELRWIRVRSFQVRDAANKLIRHIGIVTDITEQQRATRELRESERRFKDMLRNLELVSLMLDREARITWCNDYLLRLTGWSREEVIGRDWFELFLPPEHANELRLAYASLLDDQPTAGHHENEILTRSGARRLIRWNNSVLRSPSGEVIGTASIGEDITDRKRLEDQLFQSQKLETVGKLAGGIAHEFNSIMTAIIGQSELLLHDLPPGNPLCSNAIEIRQAADRAATLTRQLLAYGRKQILQPEILDLNSLLAGMESTLRHLMGRQTDVCIALAAGLKAIKADAGQIEQVIMNLAMNAAEAMPKGGKLILETAHVTLDQEYVTRFPELKAGEYVMLAMADTGAGMSDEVKARLFEPFFTTKGVGQGTGLGLSTCYGIIKQSGGHLSVYSEPARGATFKIYLPQAAAQPKTPMARLESSALPGGTETILLVEDDPALREMATALLRRLGYNVLPAANGVEALSLKRQPGIGHIDLLFTDVVMPHMSGTELAERVRAVHPYTRILFTSAYTEHAMAHQGVLNKGVTLLQKPFTPSALARKLREVLDQPAAPIPAAAQKTLGLTENFEAAN
jgi:PAS domain S-box-containing protein